MSTMGYDAGSPLGEDSYRHRLEYRLSIVSFIEGNSLQISCPLIKQSSEYRKI
jgi:hypothetical protein